MREDACGRLYESVFFFFPELYPGGKKEEREREKGNHSRKTSTTQSPDKKQPGEEKITSAVIPEGPAVC